MKNVSLKEFLDGSYHSLYVRYGPLDAYYRKQHLMIDNQRLWCLVRARTVNLKRPSNIERKEKYKRTGHYADLCRLTENLAKDYNFDAVAVENVFTEFLRDCLVRYGYERRDDPWGGPPSFVKLITR